MKNYLRAWWTSFNDIFSLKNDDAKGRTIILSSTILTTLYNVFITGLFHTGFLSMYGISITGTGILTFIPFVSNILCIFSSKILGRFLRRKRILITAKIIYYAVYILVATTMPQFVTDPDARLVCFVIIMIAASGFYAPFAPGFTTWFYNFYPEDNERRTHFLVYMQICSSVLSSIVLIFTSLLTDALKNSPYQNYLILGFRYFAFVLVLADVFLQSRAREYPYSEAENTKLTDIFTLPLQYKKFFNCMLLMFAWNFIANLVNGIWDYHLLNHMDFSYTLLNSMTVMYTVILLIFSPVWQKVLRRYSWIKTFGIALLFWFPTEFLFSTMTQETTFMFVPLRIIQNILSVGLNFAYANILYINLPVRNTTAHIAFNTIGSNMFAFLGLMTGTYISSLTGDHAVLMLGMEVYSVQLVPVIRGILMLIMGMVLVLKWRSFTRDQDVIEVEHYNSVRRKYR